MFAFEGKLGMRWRDGARRLIWVALVGLAAGAYAQPATDPAGRTSAPPGAVTGPVEQPTPPASSSPAATTSPNATPATSDATRPKVRRPRRPSRRRGSRVNPPERETPPRYPVRPRPRGTGGRWRPPTGDYSQPGPYPPEGNPRWPPQGRYPPSRYPPERAYPPPNRYPAPGRFPAGQRWPTTSDYPSEQGSSPYDDNPRPPVYQPPGRYSPSLYPDPDRYPPNGYAPPAPVYPDSNAYHAPWRFPARTYPTTRDYPPPGRFPAPPDAAPPPPEAASEPPPAPPPAGPPPAPAPVAGKPKHAAPDPSHDGAQALQIDWLGAARIEAMPQNLDRMTADKAFIDANRAAIDSLDLPLLLPGDPALLAGATLYPHGDFYTLSLTVNGLSVVLTGHARAFPLSDGAAAMLPPDGLSALIPADGVVIEPGEAGLDAEFQQFGAVYGLALQCADLTGDSRCADEAYVRQLIARMTVVLPRPGD